MKQRWKLSTAQKEELKNLYIYQGWNQQHLSKKYKIAQQTVAYYTMGLVRAVPQLTQPPIEVREYYKVRFPKPKSYQDYLDEQKRKRLSRLSVTALSLTSV